MPESNTPFAIELPPSIIQKLRDEKDRTGVNLRVITAAFLWHCLALTETGRDALVRNYLGEATHSSPREHGGDECLAWGKYQEDSLRVAASA